MKRKLRQCGASLSMFLVLLGSACGPQGDSGSHGVGEGPGVDPGSGGSEAKGIQDLSGVSILPEAWVSAWDTIPNLDSPAFWQGGDHHWVVVTAKGTHDLRVFDASTGELVRRVGGQGPGLGEFNYPNGISIRQDILFIVERDNHRVQLLRLPDFEPLGVFGEETLERPYGIALFEDEGGLTVYVTDDYGNEEDLPEGQDPSGDFTHRVSRFRVEVDGSEVLAELARQFGEAQGPGALHVVESIQVDPVHGNLLVADEHTLELELYDLEGEYRGITVGTGLYTHGDPEGIMLYSCGDSGYWILTDQGDIRTVFHLLDRVSFQHLGSFAGELTANTDGIWLTQEAVPGLGDGALFALHDDGGISAFPWETVAAAFGLQAGCGMN